MTVKQKLLKLAYPLFMWLSQKKKSVRRLDNKQVVVPPVSFYSLKVFLNNGQELPLEKLRGKKILLVNTASDCGYTAQYTELQQLYRDNKQDLEVIAFPANDFKEQEKGSDEEIALFCSRNFGVSFPMAKKSSVLKGDAQHNIFRWLSDKKLNGWNEQAPSWNFCKYLINEEGVLTNYFDSSISPVDSEVLAAINS